MDYKVILTSRFSKADNLYHSCKVQITNLYVNDLVQHGYVDVTDTRIISDPEFLFYTSCLVISMISKLCTSSMRGIFMWALIHQDLKTCSVAPSILSEHAISRYDIVASYLGIGKMKVFNIMHINRSITLIDVYFVGCCGVPGDWRLSVE